jgi:hypothetical protein
VEGNVLSSDLEQVRADLAAAEIEYASVGAKIAGLQARRDALIRALSALGGPARTAGSAGPRTDAIVDVLMATGTEMTIKEVIAALHDSGRENETYDNVAADLAYLKDQGRIARLRRGVYGRPDRIVIALTAGSLNNSYIKVGKQLGFFPEGALGSANSHDGEGDKLTVHFGGFPDPVMTDIAGAPHYDFRRARGRIRQFFTHHDLKPGDKIVIEKQSDDEYRVIPAR